jgi:hypothetical protein
MFETIETRDKVQFTRSALILDYDTTYDEWENIGHFLKTANQAVQWWIGDWLNFGEKKWGDTYTQALDATDYQQTSLRNMKWVSNIFDVSRRRDNLTWSHHMEVASLPQDLQEYWLAQCEQKLYSRNELRRYVQCGKTIEEIEAGGFSWSEVEEYKKWQEGKQAITTFVNILTDADKDVEYANRVLQWTRGWGKSIIETIDKRGMNEM